MKKLSLLLALCLFISFAFAPIGGIVANANQSTAYAGGFNTNYTLTGDGAKDIVAVAKAQEGKTTSQLKYNEAWCDNFISDCAILAGQSYAVPQGGNVGDFRSKLLKSGAYVVSTPKLGDIAIFIEGTSYAHTAICIDNNGNCMNGNLSGQVKLRHYTTTNKYNGWTCEFIRPNYTSSELSTIENVEDYYLLTAPDGYQTIRASASTSSNSLGTIPANSIVCVTKYSSDKKWGYVTYSNISGWIYLYYVEKTESPEVVDYYKLTAPDGFQTVRASTSTSSNEVGKINAGTVVCVTKYSGDKKWGYVTYNNISGWIYLYYVEKSEAPQVSDYYKLTAPDGFQSVRASTSTSSSELGRINTGTVVCVTKYSGDKKWGYVTYNNISGWIYLYYVEKSEAPHTHSYSEWTIVENPTCCYLGTRKRNCNCGDIQIENIDKTQHIYSSEFIVDIAPTYKNSGEKSKHCECCNEKTNITNIQIIPFGDINNDYQINSSDMSILITNLLSENYSNIFNDINDDGVVNILDVVEIKTIIAKQ